MCIQLIIKILSKQALITLIDCECATAASSSQNHLWIRLVNKLSTSEKHVCATKRIQTRVWTESSSWILDFFSTYILNNIQFNMLRGLICYFSKQNVKRSARRPPATFFQPRRFSVAFSLRKDLRFQLICVRVYEMDKLRVFLSSCISRR